MNNKKTRSSLETIKKLWRANAFVVSEAWNNHRRLMIIHLSLTAIGAVSPYVQRGVEALLINYLTENLGYGIDLSSNVLFWLILAVPAALLLSSSASVLQDYFARQRWRSMKMKLELQLTEKLAYLDVATHEDPQFRDKIQLIDENGSSMAVADFYSRFIGIVVYTIGFGVASIIMLKVNWMILFFVILVTIPQFLVELKYGKQIWSIYEAHSESKRHLYHAKEQVLDTGGVREVQTYRTKDFFLNRMKSILDGFHQEQRGEDKRTLFWKFLTQSLISISFVFVVWILIQPVLAGVMQIGTFVFILAATLSLRESVMGFLLQISNQYQDAEVVNTYTDVMNEERRILENECTDDLCLTKAPEIIFEDVSFFYPSDPDEYVLKDFNLTIHSGEKMAIVGVNGTGKSTLIKLLCRFYDPTGGRILINGVDLKNINLFEWYGYIALLAQDYRTYKLPVNEMIHLGRIEDEMEEGSILEASKRADADEFITKWKNTYNQQIGVEFSEGVDPSQGQKQKLALARAIFRKAFLTILDEPTSSVDAKSEARIFDQLEKLLNSEHTLILISHRFSTVRNADTIVVVDGHNIKEMGTHAQLLMKNGLYKEMYSTQAKGYKD